ncbi:restriction endonuclease subunit R [Flavobacteriaceae bacterium Ap0902]|nr:restriction endonuclease subunit R [Flavobacteriaceae bacterium Ap0902]
MQLPELNFPVKYQFRLRKRENHPSIFCPLRKKWLVLTPEEWVRQHIIQYLIQNKNYSLTSMKAEHPVHINGLNQRIDLLVYSKSTPLILIECKKPSVPITQKTLDQAMRYNLIIKAKYIYLSNGFQHIIAEVNQTEQEGLIFHQELPSLSDFPA